MHKCTTVQDADYHAYRRVKFPRTIVAPFRVMRSKVRQFLVDEGGPTAVEYAVMLSLIIAVCITAVTSIGNSAARVFSKVANSI